MTKKVKEIIRILEADGWKLHRIKGDHRIFIKEGAKRPNIIPGHLNDEVPAGTLSSILKTMKDNK